MLPARWKTRLLLEVHRVNENCDLDDLGEKVRDTANAAVDKAKKAAEWRIKKNNFILSLR